jgi:hypothetical protein
VVVHDVALSDRSGKATLRVPPMDFGFSTIEPNNDLCGKTRGSDDPIEVCVKRNKLDDSELDNIGFIKIDVEGHELEVLQGASETILRERPTLLVEIEERHRLGSLTAVHEYMESYGYTRMTMREGLLVELDSSWQPDNNPPRDSFFMQPDIADKVVGKMQASTSYHSH